MRFHSDCHGNKVTIAMRYEAKPTIHGLNMTKRKELLMYHCGCHGNKVTIAMRYVPNDQLQGKCNGREWTAQALRQISDCAPRSNKTILSGILQR